jgi:hypothetical protein
MIIEDSRAFCNKCSVSHEYEVSSHPAYKFVDENAQSPSRTHRRSFEQRVRSEVGLLFPGILKPRMSTMVGVTV